MPLQNFVDKVTAVSAAWLNQVDALKFTIFGDASTKALARTALTLDAPLEIVNGGTGSRLGVGQITLSGVDSGVVNAYSVAFTPNPTLTAGMSARFTPLNTNTGASTLNGAAVIRSTGQPLTGGELSSSGPAVVVYTGSQWQIQSSAGALPGFERTPAETTAAVVPTNYSYLPGDLRRYGAKIDSSTDDSTAISNAVKVAIAGLGFIYHPGGNCIHASQILAAGGWTLLGYDRRACLFTYTGSAASSAWRITNNGTSSPVINTSGFGLWNMDGVTITTAVASSTAAGVEINACGYSFYEIRAGARITGTFKYGVILDGAEVSHIHKGAIIDNGGPTGAANIWLTNGNDRTAGQVVGFTNSITIESVQLNVSGAATSNIIDDGGSNHTIRDNNCNGAHIPIVMAAVEGFTLTGNEIENALAGAATGNANILFTNVGKVSGATKGPCQAGKVSGNFLGADMVAGSTSLVFTSATFAIVFTAGLAANATSGTLNAVWNQVSGVWQVKFSDNEIRAATLTTGSTAVTWATGLTGAVTANANVQQMHQGIRATENWFRNNGGRVADIDVTALSNSTCKDNYAAAPGGSHYTGVHNDLDGNRLRAPQNGYGGGFTQAAQVHGDTRFPDQFWGGVDVKSAAAGLQIDEQQWQNFTVNITNSAGTLQYQIYDSPATGAASAYANKVINAGTVLTNVPTALAVGTGFGSAALGLISGGTSQMVLNTAAQAAANSNVTAKIVYYDGNVTSCNLYSGIVSRNINGVTQSRLELRLVNILTGAAVNFDTTLLPAGKSMQIQVTGYLA